jgi:hypothetical protein
MIYLASALTRNPCGQMLAECDMRGEALLRGFAQDPACAVRHGGSFHFKSSPETP